MLEKKVSEIECHKAGPLSRTQIIMVDKFAENHQPTKTFTIYNSRNSISFIFVSDFVLGQIDVFVSSFIKFTSYECS